MKISVTQKHIESALVVLARNRDLRPTHCPIALAVQDAFPTATQVRVGSAINVAFINNKDTYYRLPYSAVEFIHRFDLGAPEGVEPFTFEIKEDKNYLQRSKWGA